MRAFMHFAEPYTCGAGDVRIGMTGSSSRVNTRVIPPHRH
jgi:hypothetical protein